jgi:hypothetical protein
MPCATLFTCKLMDCAATTVNSSLTPLVSKAQMKQGVRPLDFMDLPAEIRTTIYEMTFAAMPAHIHNKRPSRPPGITRASRTLRQESLALFYAHTMFFTKIDEYSEPTTGSGGAVEFNFEAVRAWLSAIGEGNAALVQSFKVYTPSTGGIEEVKAAMRAHEDLSVIEPVTEYLPPFTYGWLESEATSREKLVWSA